jgi:hypothetical protein
MRQLTGSMPDRIARLPIDNESGYPVPWFVAYVDGKPEFRAADREKFIRAIREKLCWVCGQRLGAHITFVAGCMCGINRTSAEPPCHLECARWSAVNCPFLSNPAMVRREDEKFGVVDLRETAPGVAITRNPGVTMLWTTRQYEVFPDGMGKVLIQMGEPESIEWYREGRRATTDEIRKSIDTGLPNLEAMARTEKGGLEALSRAVKRFEKYFPVAY